MHYTDAIERFISDLGRTVDTYDWIDGPDEYQAGLDHVDTDNLNEAAFEVQIGISVEFLTEEDVEGLDADLQQLANTYGVSVRVSEANPDSCVYTFNLHSMFLGGDNGELGMNT